MPVIRPSNLSVPFASAGDKNTIPVAVTGNGKASFTGGFPAVTMMPISAGGIPPEGKDFNGILYDITTHTIWVNSGGQYLFDADLASAIGGYPAGMVLQSDSGLGAYVSAVDNNTTDFNTTPASIGTLWIPYSGNAFSEVEITTSGGVTILTDIQSACRFITVTGVLVNDATIEITAGELGWWTFINNTTGSYNVTVKPAGGAGVTIFQGEADSVYSDGVNIAYMVNSGKTRAPGDSTKAFATTEFVTLADAEILAKIPSMGKLYYISQI